MTRLEELTFGSDLIFLLTDNRAPWPGFRNRGVFDGDNAILGCKSCEGGRDESRDPLLLKLQVLEDVARLEELIKGADLIFLLTDTRESRWLPTLIAAANSKAPYPGNVQLYSRTIVQ